MRLARNLTLLAAGALMLSACAFGDATSDARKAIQGLYDTDNAAAMRKDVNAIFLHTAPDYVATDKQGKKLDLTVRVTDVYKKARGRWQIIHEHVSVPVDLETGKPDLTSKP